MWRKNFEFSHPRVSALVPGRVGDMEKDSDRGPALTGSQSCPVPSRRISWWGQRSPALCTEHHHRDQTSWGTLGGAGRAEAGLRSDGCGLQPGRRPGMAPVFQGRGEGSLLAAPTQTLVCPGALAPPSGGGGVMRLRAQHGWWSLSRAGVLVKGRTASCPRPLRW